MTPDEILDYVLEFIYAKNGLNLSSDDVGFKLETLRDEINHDYTSRWVDNNQNPVEGRPIQTAEMLSILLKLGRDGYLEQGIKPNKFLITFEGRWFIADGGYTKRKEILDASENRLQKLQSDQIRFASQLNNLTVVIASGTALAAVYYVVEMLKNHCSFCSLSLRTVLFLSLSLAIAAATVWLIAKEKYRRKMRTE